MTEEVTAALPSFVERGQRSVYRSMMRAAVKTIDPVKPPRAFSDKDEWKAVLMSLQTAGKLTYFVDSDTIVLS